MAKGKRSARNILNWENAAMHCAPNSSRTRLILLLSLSCLLSACSSMTSSVGTTRQMYQEIKAASRIGYLQVHQQWLKERRQDCRVPKTDGDDPIHQGEAGPDWREVSIGLWNKIEMGCPVWMLQHPK